MFTLRNLALAATVLAAGVAGQPAAAQYAYITNSLSDDITVVDTATDTVVASIGGFQGPQAIEVHPDGSRLYVANNGLNGEGHTISVVDLATHTIVSTIDLGQYGGPEGMAMYPDGSRLYVATGGIHQLPPDGIDDQVVVIDLATETIKAVIPVGDHPWDVGVSPDGSKLWVANAHSETLMVIDPDTETVTDTLLLGDGGNNFGADHHTAVVELSPDGSEAWVAHMHEDRLSVIDTATLAIKQSLDLRDPDCDPRPPDGGKATKCEHTMGMAFHPDGSKIYVGRFFKQEISVFDAKTYTELARVTVNKGPKALGMHPDGSRLYFGNQFDNLATVFDTTTDTVKTTFAVGTWPIPYGRFFGPLEAVTGMLTGVEPGPLRCQNLTSGQTLRVSASGRWWNCGAAGFTAAPGDLVRLSLAGTADTIAEVGGSVTGLEGPLQVICQNRTTGGRVQGVLSWSAPWWNCQRLGLAVTPGDAITMTVGGRFRAPAPAPTGPGLEPRVSSVAPPPFTAPPHCPPNGVGGCDLCAEGPHGGDS